MISFSARYYDGETSRSHDVGVQVDEGGTLRVSGLSESVVMPAGDLRISPRLGNTVRSLTLPSGEKLETADNAAVDALQRQLGRGAVLGIVHQLESRWRTAIAAAVLLAAVVVGGAKWGIPLLARVVADRIPPALAFDLGKGTLATLDRTLFSPSRLKDDTKARLLRSFRVMAEAYPGLPVRLEFRHAGFPNAFALPSGTIVATDELVELADGDEQVLSVLAHEIGHLHHRHSLRMALESSTVALLIGAYLGDATQFAAVSASLPTVYAQAQYSQGHEVEADTFALEYMVAHGIAPHHFADVLTKLERELGAGGDGASALQYISSHPPTQARIERFR